MFTNLLRSTVLIPLFAGAMVAQAPAAAVTPAPAVEAASAGAQSDVAIQPTAIGAPMAAAGISGNLRLAPDLPVMVSQSTGENVGTNRAMMGAGAAAMIIGLVVGGDVGTLVAVGGAIFALVGLYRYMQ